MHAWLSVTDCLPFAIPHTLLTVESLIWTPLLKVRVQLKTEQLCLSWCSPVFLGHLKLTPEGEEARGLVRFGGVTEPPSLAPSVGDDLVAMEVAGGGVGGGSLS